jgi:hypothetical protein
MWPEDSDVGVPPPSHRAFPRSISIMSDKSGMSDIPCPSRVFPVRHEIRLSDMSGTGSKVDRVSGGRPRLRCAFLSSLSRHQYQ